MINIQVSQGKFDVINKWCHAEVNQAYPTCAIIKFIFRVKNFLVIYDEFWGQWETEIFTHAYFMDVWVYFSFPLSRKSVANG